MRSVWKLVLAQGSSSLNLPFLLLPKRRPQSSNREERQNREGYHPRAETWYPNNVFIAAVVPEAHIWQVNVLTVIYAPDSQPLPAYRVLFIKDFLLEEISLTTEKECTEITTGIVNKVVAVKNLAFGFTLSLIHSYLTEYFPYFLK